MACTVQIKMFKNQFFIKSFVVVFLVGNFGFDDHNAPPFELMEPCCRDLDEWLSQGPEYIACVHCKAGKVCFYLKFVSFRVFSIKFMAFNHQLLGPY